MAAQGAIELVPNAARGIRLLGERGLPLLGRVAAAADHAAIENQLGLYPVDPSLFNPRADYLLQVRGLSMRDDGILDGDWLVVHRTTEAKSGQIVVARINDEVTVKRYRIRGQKAELIPSNPDFKTLHLDLSRQSLAIEGIAVGVIRNLLAAREGILAEMCGCGRLARRLISRIRHPVATGHHDIDADCRGGWHGPFTEVCTTRPHWEVPFLGALAGALQRSPVRGSTALPAVRTGLGRRPALDVPGGAPQA